MKEEVGLRATNVNFFTDFMNIKTEIIDYLIGLLLGDCLSLKFLIL